MKAQELEDKIVKSLMPITKWSKITDYIEKMNPDVAKKKETSPSIYAKHRIWLLDSEIFVLSNLIVLRQLRGQTPLTQGQLARIAAGNPYKEGLSETEIEVKKKLNVKWNNNIRNNVKPIMGDFFNLLIITTNGGEVPGTKGYSISASETLMNFFKEKVYFN